jgi:hypothetical protein
MYHRTSLTVVFSKYRSEYQQVILLFPTIDSWFIVYSQYQEATVEEEEAEAESEQ